MRGLFDDPDPTPCLDAAPFRYGTSSWTAKGWERAFYPTGCKPAEYLAQYAHHFSVVEADVTYYRVPSASMIAGWRRRTPESFRVAAKFPRSIVHAGEGPRPDGSRVLVPDAVGDDTRAFLTAMDGLGERCGPLVLQFPWFHRSVFPDKQAFLARLDDYLAALPATHRYAVEVRNGAWLDDELCDVLRRRGATLVLCEMARMPHPEGLARALDVLTSDMLYVRLIGDRQATEARTSVFDRVVLDQSASLRRWGALLSTLAERVQTAWVFANNHYAGYAPDTIRSLADAVALARSGG